MKESQASATWPTGRRVSHVRSLWLACFFLLSFLIALIAAPKSAFAFNVPQPDGAITDRAGTLTFEEGTALETKIRAYRDRTTNEIGVLIIPSLEGESVESVANQTFNTWGIGKKDHNNGVLLLIAKAERTTRIETGNGVRDRLTDADAARVLELLAVHLRDGHFAEGIDSAVLAIEAELDAAPSNGVPTPITTTDPAPTAPPAPKSPVTTTTSEHSSVGSFVIILLGGFAVFALCKIWLIRDRRRHGDGYYYDSSSSSYSNYSSWDSGGSSSFSSGGSSFDSGGGGGGSSFSGGSSDGGGSSGSY